jgi:hypothetical protein
MVRDKSTEGTMLKGKWSEDLIKVLLRKPNLVICQHPLSGDVLITVKGDDGQFHSAELSREEFQALHTSAPH